MTLIDTVFETRKISYVRNNPYDKTISVESTYNIPYK